MSAQRHFHNYFSNLTGVFQKKLKAGEVLFRQGDPADWVFSVISGELRLLRYSSDGHAVCLHRARSGESFAEAALFFDHYHCNGEVVGETRVWCYPRAAVLRRLREDPDCMENVFDLLARQVRGLRLQLELRGISSATERVLQFLRLRADDNGAVSLSGTLMIYAQELGMAHETLYRALAELERSGHIARPDKKLILINP